MKLLSTFTAVVLGMVLTEVSFAQNCTCGCGNALSGCLSTHPCEGAEQWYDQNEANRSKLSAIGVAQGETNDGKSFPNTASAGGSVRLNVMSAKKDLRNINGDWHANWVSTKPSPSSPYKTQEWRFMAAPKGDTPGQLIGTGRATITGDENGASGLIHGWKVVKVVNNKQTLVNVTARVEFHGGRLQITDFYEDLSPGK
jgi:hypothetical protein